MRELSRIALPAIAALWVAACAIEAPKPDAARLPPPAARANAVAIPEGKDNDLKLYYADGRIAKGAAALSAMQRDAGLILWLAGNQFFAMDDVVRAFQVRNPGVAVGLITLPPGLLVEAIVAGGWTRDAIFYPGTPDIYASVNLGHLQKLKKAGLMERYAVYMHNELEIMVARGNPKGIRGIEDLARADVRTSMPNPVNEGIMQFYARKVLERHGIWNQISAGKECFSCQTTPQNWFTSVHHRETPDRIKAGTSDAGIVWRTESQEAMRSGAAVDSVALPAQDSLRDEVAYVIGDLSSSPRKAMAVRYLEFVKSPACQDAYAKFGFVKAGDLELELVRIPD